MTPDLERFNDLLRDAVLGREMDGERVALDFRRLFLREPDLGRRVLFVLMTWCGEYDATIPKGEDLPRWAGKREIAARLKAALYGDIETPLTKEPTHD